MKSLLDASRAKSLFEEEFDDVSVDELTNASSANRIILANDMIKKRGRRNKQRNKSSQESSKREVIFSPASTKVKRTQELQNHTESRDDIDDGFNRSKKENKNCDNANTKLLEPIPTTISISSPDLLDLKCNKFSACDKGGFGELEKEGSGLFEENGGITVRKRVTIIEPIHDLSLYSYPTESFVDSDTEMILSISGTFSIDEHEYQAFVREEKEKAKKDGRDLDIVEYDNLSPNAPLEISEIRDACCSHGDTVTVAEIQAHELSKLLRTDGLEDDNGENESKQDGKGNGTEAKSRSVSRASRPLLQGILKNKASVNDVGGIKSNEVVDSTHGDKKFSKLLRMKGPIAKFLSRFKSNKVSQKSPFRVMAMLTKKKKKDTVLRTRILVSSTNADDVVDKNKIKDNTNKEKKGKDSDTSERESNVNMESLLLAVANLKSSLEKYDNAMNSKPSECTRDVDTSKVPLSLPFVLDKALLNSINLGLHRGYENGKRNLEEEDPVEGGCRFAFY
jgi:hypothetical protein